MITKAVYIQRQRVGRALAKVPPGPSISSFLSELVAKRVPLTYSLVLMVPLYINKHARKDSARTHA